MKKGNNYLIDTNEEKEKKIIETLLVKDRIDVIDNDKEHLKQNDIEALKKHNEYFNKLLDVYVSNSKINLEFKLIFKTFFFFICLIILMCLYGLLAGCSLYCLNNAISIDKTITIMFTNIISFLTSFIVLPRIIANYLFDSKEENNVFEITKNMQEYDKDLRDRL